MYSILLDKKVLTDFGSEIYKESYHVIVLQPWKIVLRKKSIVSG